MLGFCVSVQCGLSNAFALGVSRLSDGQRSLGSFQRDSGNPILNTYTFTLLLLPGCIVAYVVYGSLQCSICRRVVVAFGYLSYAVLFPLQSLGTANPLVFTKWD